MGRKLWGENYGEKAASKETIGKRLKKFQKEVDKQHTQKTYHTRDRGAR